MRTPPTRVLAIGLDAADARHVLRWAESGELPVLGRMLREGGCARLSSACAIFPESTWATVATGRDVGGHGIYNWRTIRPGTYERALAPDGRHRPFWAGLDAALVVDVPYIQPLGDDRFTEVAAWGQRGASAEASWPPGLLDELHERHGRYPQWVNVHHHRGGLSSRRLLRALERLAGERTEMLLRLMAERPWSLGLAAFSEPHDAGHEFQRHLDPGGWGASYRRAGGTEDGLLRVLQACDRGLERLWEAAGPDAHLVVFSGMGLTRNGVGEELLGDLLVRLGYQAPAPPSGGLLASRPVALARRAVPWSVRRFLHFRLSRDAQERVMVGLWTGSVDWARSRAFGEGEPHAGGVRLNVRGREPEGIVERGAEYDALCDEIARELLQVVDADTGEPAILTVTRREDIAGPDDAHMDELPDLVIQWSGERLLRAVRHPRIEDEVTQNVRDVPYTEHTGEGFLFAAGPSVRAGARTEGRLTDVTPTLLTLLGEEVPPELTGTPLTGLLRESAAAVPPPNVPN